MVLLTITGPGLYFTLAASAITVRATDPKGPYIERGLGAWGGGLGLVRGPGGLVL